MEPDYTCAYDPFAIERRFQRLEGNVMSGYVVNIENETLDNENFRRVLHTAQHSQLVVMSLLPGEEIGSEVHDLDQFIRVESGEGVAVLDGEQSILHANWAVVVPAGTRHNIINASLTRKLKLYTIYSPPEHTPGTVHRTRDEALMAERR
jgi:mannose-6-phosphate isomerase-like protein (cupin superfamily)